MLITVIFENTSKKRTFWVVEEPCGFVNANCVVAPRESSIAFNWNESTRMFYESRKKTLETTKFLRVRIRSRDRQTGETVCDCVSDRFWTSPKSKWTKTTNSSRRWHFWVRNCFVTCFSDGFLQVAHTIECSTRK